MKPSLGRDFRIVARDVGALQALLGVTMVLPLLVSLIVGEFYSALSFLLSGVVAFATGLWVYRWCREAGEPRRVHAMMIAGAGWLSAAAFGSLPFLLAAYLTPEAVAQGFVPVGADYPSSLIHFRNPLHAFFESMSAYTTTGLTMAVNEPTIGWGLLFYRSFAQWIGGAGVIVLALAIIPRPDIKGELELYQSEATGIKLRPRVLGTARAIWRVYVGLTLLVAVYLFAATMLILPDYGVWPALFDAINHAMTAQSTGGFSTLDDSIAGYGSSAMELIHIPPMMLGAISIPLYYAFLRRREFATFWRDPQFRLMLKVVLVVTPVLVLLLVDNAAVADPVREGVFQVISAMTTTGWQTSAIGDWSESALMWIVFGTMLVGGSAGATVGGIKMLRAYLLIRGVSWRVRRVFFSEQAVVPFRLGNQSLPTSEMRQQIADAAVFTFFYLAVLGLSIVLVAAFAGNEFTLGDVIFECASAQGTVGLSSGITDPSMHPLVEMVFILQMWLGRLEIFPVIVLLLAAFRPRNER